MKTCKTCVHWTATYSECRRWAPEPARRGRADVGASRRWPITHKNDGCGEHPTNAAMAQVAFGAALAVIMGDLEAEGGGPSE